MDARPLFDESVLILEDVPYLPRKIARRFENLWNVVITGSCRAALEQAQNPKLDGAVLDVRLPDGCGLYVAERLRGAHPSLPILILTGYLDQEVVRRAHLLGAEPESKLRFVEAVDCFVRNLLCRKWISDESLRDVTRESIREAKLSLRQAEIAILAALAHGAGEIRSFLHMEESNFKSQVAILLHRVEERSLAEYGETRRRKAGISGPTGLPRLIARAR